MKYKIIYHKLGEMPTTSHVTNNLFDTINYIVRYVVDAAPAYVLEFDNKDDPWDRIMAELIKQKLSYIDGEDPDFIKYCLPNGIVIEATAIDG